ncbi:hypothetical protein JEM67_23860 [Serratia sp. PAMC26656]|uniref:hypothetical protein n=1 Tax=Serratia sp. PAMC26656 TaxID=2775909 RepID=UPI001F1EC4CD|nr:hypothetical protein [Serratia sp. PAMC26656]
MLKGYFFYPLAHVKRTLVFGVISGVAITLAAIVFKIIDKLKTKKAPPKESPLNPGQWPGLLSLSPKPPISRRSS